MINGYELEFNGQAFRVIELRHNRATGATERVAVGNSSADLQLALWSASSALGRRWITIPLQVSAP